MSGYYKATRVDGTEPTWLARFGSKVVPDGECLRWVGGIGSHGYGQFAPAGRGSQVLAHRLIYETIVGPIPTGMQIDHLCRNRWCVYVDHLEPVTQAENIRRGTSPSAVNARRSVCSKGHDALTPRADGRGRRCKTCDDIYNGNRPERVA